MLENGTFAYFQEQDSEPNGSTHCVITSMKAVCDSHHRSDISFGSCEVIADHIMPQLKTRYFQPVTVTTTNSFMTYHKIAMFNFVSPADDIDGTVEMSILFTTRANQLYLNLQRSLVLISLPRPTHSSQITTQHQHAPYKQPASQTPWPKFSQP